MRYGRFALLALLILSHASWAWADSAAPAVPKATASSDGHYVFIIVPQPDDDARKNTQGAMFEVQPDGTLAKRWECSGWYADTVYVANDGLHLVRLNSWPEGDGVSALDTAVAFYRSGTLLKSFATRDLVKDKKQVKGSMTHFRWLAPHPAQQPQLNDRTFTLTTIDGQQYTFDVTTGAVTSSRAVRVFRP
jgi:hypothetical protein